MRAVPAPYRDALAARQLVARDFLWLVARTRAAEPLPAPVGFWSDLGNINAEVIDPDSGAPVIRPYYGTGTLIKISDVALVSNLTVQTVNIQLSQLADAVTQAVRVYDAKQARVEIHRGLFDPETLQLVAPALPRFYGFVDVVDIKTPAEGGDGAVALRCLSHTQEMTRSNPDTRSHQSQVLRAPGDSFFEGAENAGEIEHFWGKANGKLGDGPGQGGGGKR